MPKTPSQSSHNRESGKHQVGEQRASILDAAERLFLRQGIETTSMSHIAAAAGITRVTLYRYFANRDEVAVAVHLHLLHKSEQLLQIDRQDASLAGQKKRVLAMIRNFDRLHDLFRYTGMFDQVYLDHPSDSTLTHWTLDQLITADLDHHTPPKHLSADANREALVVINSTVVWFLEKLALRGELTWSDKAVPLAEHLRIFAEMITGYFDRLIAEQSRPPASRPPDAPGRPPTPA